MPETVLVVDDEPKIVTLIKGYLEAAGFKVLKAGSGREALTTVGKTRPDCLILDINMPDMDGLDTARELKKTGDTPIIFLTARAEETDRIVGLELGADDYVVKPFSPRELVARVRAVLRRARPKPPAESDGIRVGDLALDRQKRSVAVRGKPVRLTSIQFDILALMMGRPGKVWTRLEILEGSSGAAYEGYERTVDAHIKNIRKALGDDSENSLYVETVRGVGYRIVEPGDEA